MPRPLPRLLPLVLAIPLAVLFGCASPRDHSTSFYRFNNDAAAAADAIEFMLGEPGLEGGNLWYAVDPQGVDNEYSSYREDCIWKTAFANRHYFPDVRLTTLQLESWYRAQAERLEPIDDDAAEYLLRILRHARYAAPLLTFDNPHLDSPAGKLFDIFELDTEDRWLAFVAAWRRMTDKEDRALILECVPDGRELDALKIAEEWEADPDSGLDGAAAEFLIEACKYLRLRAHVPPPKHDIQDISSTSE